VKNIFKRTKLKKLHIVRWQLVMYGRPAGPGFVSGYVGFASSTRMFFFITTGINGTDVELAVRRSSAFIHVNVACLLRNQIDKR
jgi:hypothetical protein